MNKREAREIGQALLDIYCGALFNASQFAQGEPVVLEYRFDCPEYVELKMRYPIEDVAGRGGDFVRALRLCRWLAPRLRHKSDYDNHVPCNALALLDYCFEKSDVGINCLNKAKILAECCLAVGIIARRVSMMPASPYDSDNHVITEIYDRKRKKWVALDPTTGGYFSAGAEPLSTLELRALFAEHKPVSVVLNRQNPARLDALCVRNLDLNGYYAKNSYYYGFDTVSAFGIPEENRRVFVAPEGFDVARQQQRRPAYWLERYGADAAQEVVEEMERWLANTKSERPCIASTALWDSPVL